MRSSAASTPPVKLLCRPPTRFSPSGVSFDDAITMLDGHRWIRRHARGSDHLPVDRAAVRAMTNRLVESAIGWPNR